MCSEGSMRILLVDDEEIVHHTLGPYLKDLGHLMDNAYEGVTALRLIEANNYDLALIDIRMPGMDGLSILSKIKEMCPELSVIMITGHGNMETVIQALRLGAVDFLAKPVKLFELDAVLEKSTRIHSLRQSQRHLKETIKGIQTSEDARIRNRLLVRKSKAMTEVKNQIRLAVKAQCETILISGETGTGKEVVAREIHFTGGEGAKPFIPVSCPALPETLIESELFGHVKGAFTSANIDKAGYFELADGGTLFLDEIADLSFSAQAKLLRVLETRKIRRIGGSKEIDVNIRVIAATNTPMEKLVESKKFRKDLYYRLNVFTINLLPLRQRRSDIIPLAEHFLSTFLVGRRLPVDDFSKKAKYSLINYDFPGNARELRNIVERAAILCQSSLIEPIHLNLPKAVRNTPADSSQLNEEQARQIILDALEKAKWNRRQASENLKIPYSSLRYKLKKLHIS